MLRCIDFGSKPGELILDPFIGNGTTAMAFRGSFRHFLWFEENLELKDVINANVQKVKLRQFYTPYFERPDPLVEKARKEFGISSSDLK